ncbi:E3 ubiquitin-protein ligase Topors [Hyperolius riggenbachi]|uniref:E3 ubiquitin-protein ligase Topors n=1 Tax=Hyperolius riggenbachi TaxID=752182 RepID=UPI0035A38C17
MGDKRNRRRKAARRDEPASSMQTTTADDFIGASSCKASSRKSHGKGSPTDVSPDSKCPICLDRFENISHLDRCLHRFCFKCIKEWAKNKAECPLCKQPFHSIFHSVKAEDDFKEYVLRPSVNGSFASPDGQRFRYRTTMTRENRLSTRTLRSSTQRTFPLADSGVLFEGFTNRQSNRRSNNIQQMMRRLASRRQASAEGRAMRQIQEQDLVNFRRALYRSGIRVRNIQDGGRYRDISAEFFRRNPACLHRLIPWLKRELTVLFGTHGSLVNIVQHIIMSNVTRFDMESRAFLEDLQPFLLHRTEHFLHEFINFARCPYNIDAYDQHANYDCPAPSYEEGSESESSVITISPDDNTAREPDIPSSSVEVGQAPWDDETPGPSYSTIEQVTNNLTSIDSSDDEPSSSILASSDLKNDNTDDIQDQSLPSDDCVIVGFVKPLAERTPELVELSSDSELSLCEVKIEQTKKPEPSHLILSGSSESHRSSSVSSVHSIEKQILKRKHKRKTSSDKTHSKKKEKKLTDASTKKVRKSRKDEGHSYDSTARRRERSWSSDCYSRSSCNKSYDGYRKWNSKSKQRTKTREKRHKSRKEKRSRSRDRSLSWRSRTVSLSSESSKERNVSSSRNRKRSKGRSQSHERTDNYRSTYQWEYTYYSRNRDREEFEKSYKKHSRGRSHCSRSSPSPDYHLPSFSQKRDSKKQKETSASKRHHRSRSHSNSRIHAAGAQQTQSEKPGGKRKYKTRHLEPQSKKDGTDEKDNHVQADLEAQDDNLADKSSIEPKQKWKKTTRSPSVEIVYEGRCSPDVKHHKKKKKKHKKKRKHENSPPIVIRIDSDSDSPVRLDIPSSSNMDSLPGKTNSVESDLLLPSKSPTTSAIGSTTEPNCVDEENSYSRPYNLPSVKESLDSSSDILEGLDFGDNFDGEDFLPALSPPKTPSIAETELSLPDCNLENCDNYAATPVAKSPQETENSPETFAESVYRHLDITPASTPVTASPESVAEDTEDAFPENMCEHLEDMTECLSPLIL